MKVNDAARGATSELALCLLVLMLACAGGVEVASAQTVEVDSPGTAGPGEQTRAPRCQVTSVTNLTRCVAVGKRIQVTTLIDGRRRNVTGEFRGYSQSQLLLHLGGDRFAFFDDADVEQVMLMLDEHAFGKAQVIGAVVGAGVLAALRASAKGPGDQHVPGPAYFGLLGAVGGYGIASELDPDKVTVLDRRPTSFSTPAGAAPAPTPQVTADLTSIVSRLTVGDRLVIHDAAQAPTAGRYVGVEGDTVILRVGDSIQRVPGRERFLVSRDHTHHPSARKGALVGGMIGLVLMGLVVAEDRVIHSPEPLTVGEGVGSIFLFAGVGAIATRAIGRGHEVVLVRPPQTTTRVSPPQRGVRWTFRFRRLGPRG